MADTDPARIGDVRALLSAVGDEIVEVRTEIPTTAVEVGADPAGSADSAQAYSIQRANHTGAQAIGTVTGLQTALDDRPTLVGGNCPRRSSRRSAPTRRSRSRTAPPGSR